MVAERIDAALRAAGLPIVSVRVSNEADRSSWVVEYAPSATDGERATGDALLATFDPEAADVIEAVDTATAEAGLDTRWSKAQILWMLRLTLGREPSAEEQDAARASLVQAYKDVSA